MNPNSPPDLPQQSPQLSPQDPQATSDATGGVIPYKNPQALIGYYLGVFSLIPILGLLLGPAALILGILGFRSYLREPRKRGQAHAWVAMILGTLVLIGHLAFFVFLVSNR